MARATEYSYGLLRSGEEQAAVDLVEQTFLSQVAPFYPPEGVDEFLSYVSVQAISQRLAAHNFMLAAYGPEGLTGIVEIDCSREHIALFFVKKETQGQGVGRKLLSGALQELKNRKPDLAKVTVNSSPNSVEAYRALGFFATDYQQEHNGISFRPMAIHLGE